MPNLQQIYTVNEKDTNHTDIRYSPKQACEDSLLTKIKEVKKTFGPFLASVYTCKSGVNGGYRTSGLGWDGRTLECRVLETFTRAWTRGVFHATRHACLVRQSGEKSDTTRKSE